MSGDEGDKTVDPPGDFIVFGIGGLVLGLQDFNVNRLRLCFVLMILILIPEICLMKAGKAGRQPQMMPHVISATL